MWRWASISHRDLGRGIHELCIERYSFEHHIGAIGEDLTATKVVITFPIIAIELYVTIDTCLGLTYQAFTVAIRPIWPARIELLLRVARVCRVVPPLNRVTTRR